MKVGSRIKELRIARGLTQEALASALGIKPQAVSKWECDVNFPDVSMLPAISVFFGVSIDSLFSMTRADELERVENRLSQAGLLTDDEVRQIEEILCEEDPDGASEVLLSKLYCHQAEEYLKKAAQHAAESLFLCEGSADAVKAMTESYRGASPTLFESSRPELITAFKDYLGRDPSASDVCAALIDNLIADERLDEAKKWTSHLEKTDLSFRPLVYKDRIAALTGNEETALAALTLLTECYRDDTAAQVYIADIFCRRGEYDKALSYIIRASGTDDARSRVSHLITAAKLSELAGNIDDALAYYREALKVLKEEDGIVGGAGVDAIRQKINSLSTAE